MVSDISSGKIATLPFVPIRPPAVPLGFTLTIPSGSPYAPGQDPLPNFGFVAPDLYATVATTSTFVQKFVMGKGSVSLLFSKAITRGASTPVSTHSPSPSVTPSTPAKSAPSSPSETPAAHHGATKPSPKLFGRIKAWVSKRKGVDAI